ncbi:transposase [Streptomyces sp. 3330]|nr:transposase [Streptomyces sp. 3330]
MIAQLVQADEDTIRDVIYRFNEIGLACLDPEWAGGRPRLRHLDDEDLVVQTATTRPTKLGQPFTRWSIRKLAAHLRRVHGRVIRIGREALRCLLARRGITFQRSKTWKESPDPERDTKLDRIEHVLERFPDRVFAFDEFGSLGIRPTGGSGWPPPATPSGTSRPTTAPTASATSTAAIRSATTPCGASTTARRPCSRIATANGHVAQGDARG